MDGATLTQRFRYIVLPQLLPTIALLAVLRFIFTFNKFDDIYLLTGGGAGTEVVSRAGVRLPHVPRRRGRGRGAGPGAGARSSRAARHVLRFFGQGGRHEQPACPQAARRSRTATFGVLRWVVIAVLAGRHALPLLLHGAAVGEASTVAARPGELWVSTRSSPSAPTAGARPVEDGGQGFLLMLRNSALVALARWCSLCWCVPGAYAISRLRFFGAAQVSALFLAVYLFPAILLAVPLFVFFSPIGLRGSLVGLVIVYIAQTVPVSIYMLRNYFETIPISMEEAAAIDGARPQTIRRVSLPLAAPR